MEKQEQVTKVNWRIPKWFPELEPAVLEKLKLFHVELLRFNEKINLISRTSKENADLVHFSDCILTFAEFRKYSSDTEIFDLGSGNGFPGIIFAILDPSLRVILVEKDTRKAEFLKHMGFVLDLKNVEVRNILVEDIEAGSIKCAISRGFASIGKSLIAVRKGFAEDCNYFHMKSNSWASEAANIPTQICSFWKPILVSEYALPDRSAVMFLVNTKKVGK